MTTNELLLHRIGELEDDLKALAQRTERLLWALVTLSLSLAGSAVVFALTVAWQRGR